MKLKSIIFAIAAVVLGATSCAQKGIYQFEVEDAEGQTVKLSSYKGKVLLVVNTASHCGFTPQYQDLDDLYEMYNAKGFEILDFPCNQFGNQAPESDEEYVEFCKSHFDTQFKQFHKIDVNGEDEIPLYTFLKQEQGFVGFDPDHKLSATLEGMFDKTNPGWRESSDIKWNFTKFLVDRKGNVVYRFEPTATYETMSPKIKELL